MSSAARIRQPAVDGAADRAVVSLLVAAGVCTQRLDARCREHGITLDQYNVLRILRGAGTCGRARCEIAERLISRAPDVTRLLDRLERHGLITRCVGAENRRYSVATITDDGLRRLDALDPEIRAIQRELTAGLSAEELTTLAGLCEAIVR